MKLELTPQLVYERLIEKYDKDFPDWLEGLFIFLGNVQALEVKASDPKEYFEKVKVLLEPPKRKELENAFLELKAVLNTDLELFRVLSNPDVMKLLIAGIEKFIWHVDFKDKNTIMVEHPSG